MPHPPTPRAAVQLAFAGAPPPGPAPDCPHGRAGRLPAPRPRVISVSKRTDIPAFYLPWLRQCCDAGWVDVPNPLYRHASDPCRALTHVSLWPEHVLAIVWWSKNYAVYLRLHEAFARYPVQYFHFTINPRRPDLAWLEPDVPSEEAALEQLAALVRLREPALVAWRYDPLVFWWRDGRPESNWDAAFFARMCEHLERLGVRRAFTSVADRYAKVERRVRRHAPGVALRDPEPDELDAIVTTMRELAAAHGIQLFACTEQPLVERGLERGACIDGRLLSAAACQRASAAPATDTKMPGREACGCTLHTDIGDYQTQECGYACIYCYANPNHRRYTRQQSQYTTPDVSTRQLLQEARR